MNNTGLKEYNKFIKFNASFIIQLMLFDFKNVFYRRLRALEFSDLSESEYIKNVLHFLFEKMRNTFYNYEFHIYSCNGASNEPFPINLLHKTKKHILLYLSDETSAIPYSLIKPFFAVFKCYLPDMDNGHVYSFPLGYSGEIPERPVADINNRSLNVFFSGHLHMNRIGFYESVCQCKLCIKSQQEFYDMRKTLRKNFSERFQNSLIKFTDGFRQGLIGDEYAKMLYDSKIVICPEGYINNETFRHYEAIRAGCIVISKPLIKSYLSNAFPIVIINDWTDLDKTINELLDHPDKMSEIHHQTVKLWKEKCDEKAVAECMNKKILLLENR